MAPKQVVFQNRSSNNPAYGITKTVIQGILDHIEEFRKLVPEYITYSVCPFLGKGVAAHVWQISDNLVLRFSAEELDLSDVNDFFFSKPLYYSQFYPWNLIITEKMKPISNEVCQDWKRKHELELDWKHISDVHVENVMMNSVGEIKIVDYGCSSRRSPWPIIGYSNEELYEPILIL